MSDDVTGSEMSSSVNSDASYDIDIVRHHDGESLLECPLSSSPPTLAVATSTANLLDASDSYSDTDSEDTDISRFGGKQKTVRASFKHETQSRSCSDAIFPGSRRGGAARRAAAGGRGPARVAGRVLAHHVDIIYCLLIMMMLPCRYLMFVLFLLYKRRPNMPAAVR